MKLIIGASGAVGIPTIKNMIKSGHEFCVLSSNEESALKLRALGVVNVIVGDYREDGVLASVMRDVQSVCYIPARHIEDELEVGKSIVDAAKVVKLDHFLFCSAFNAFTININGFPFTNSMNTAGGIYIVRDPRDVALSLSNHFNISHQEAVDNMKNMQHYEFYDVNLSKGFKRTIMGNWPSNYNSWRYYQGRDIHLVKYEDMIKEPTNTFYKILKYINLFKSFDLDEKKIKNAIETTSFKNLSKMENEKGFKELGSGSNFFRKGKIGDWQESLEPRLAKEIENNFKKEMKELGYI